MSGSDGSTTLTPEQTTWFKDKHGAAYIVVQTNAEQPSRKQRRAQGQRQRAHGQGLRIVSEKSLWRFVRAHQ